MPRPGRMTTERAKDFKGSLLQLLRTMGKYKLSLIVVVVFAILSTIFNIAGPKILAKATTALATGWIAKLRGTGAIDFGYIGKILLILLGGLAVVLLALPVISAVRSVKRSTACLWPILKNVPWAKCSPASPTMWTPWAKA